MSPGEKISPPDPLGRPGGRTAGARHVLEVRDLTIALPRFADRSEAASRVSFSVDRGEIVCLVGESGSG